MFEKLVINEFVKESYNRGVEPGLSFWRDSTGNEVDLLRMVGGKQYAYEIKSGATYSPDFFKGISKWANYPILQRNNVSRFIMEIGI